MRRSITALILGITLGGAGVSHAADVPVPATTTSDQVLQILSEGVNEYYTGRYDQAAARFADALAMNPDNKLIYEFYLAIGHEKFMGMTERAELSEVMKDILRKYNIYLSELRDSEEYIKLLISKLDEEQGGQARYSDEKKRFVATRELVAIGPIAVPHLIEKLVDNREDRLRVYARIVLTQMGYRAVVPLCEALKAADARVVNSVAVNLGDIKDPRALPKLQELIDNHPDETVKRVAANAVAQIAESNGLPVIPEGESLYFQEAMRYFRDGDQVPDESVANEALMWRWDESASPKLTYVTVPRYAWNELVAEQLLFDGASSYTDYTGFYPLMSINFAAQIVETELRKKLAETRLTNPTHPDETLAAIDARLEALTEMPDRISAFGPTHLLRGLQQAITSERYDVAVNLMTYLQDNYLTDPEDLLPSKEEGLMAGKPGTVLIAALDHGDRRVAYHAAVTLAHLDPKLEFFNAEKVIPLLSDAVGEWGMKVVLVVEPDYRARNAARKALQSEGFLVFTASDGFEARARLAETPVKDAVVIAGDLIPSLRDEFGRTIDVPEQTAAGLIGVLKEDARTANTPVFLSLPENKELAVKIQNELGDQVKAVVQEPFNGVEMAGEIDLALGDAEFPELNRQAREDISFAAAHALRSLNPVKTQFALNDALPALLGTIAHRADRIRVETLEAIGRTGDASRINAVTDVYLEQDRSGDLANDEYRDVNVRIAFLNCIGNLDPNTPDAVEIIKAAMQHSNRDVRKAAHLAAGHGRDIAPSTLLEYQVQQRLDVRAPGAAE